MQFSIVVPHASFWPLQKDYQTILSTSDSVVIAGLLAFLTSQILDVVIYQKIKNASQGKLLWLRSNLSTFMGQFVDSAIFVTIVFSASQNKLSILWGSMIVKIIISILMTPIVYSIIIGINKYLGSNTLAFKASGGEKNVAKPEEFTPDVTSLTLPSPVACHVPDRVGLYH